MEIFKSLNNREQLGNESPENNIVIEGGKFKKAGESKAHKEAEAAMKRLEEKHAREDAERMKQVQEQLDQQYEEEESSPGYNPNEWEVKNGKLQRRKAA